MKVQIKKTGNSLCIILPAPMVQFHDLKEKDWVDMSDIIRLPESKIEYKELKDIVKQNKEENGGENDN